jgi:ribosomal-protein-serine acetyltransferase
VSSSLTIPILNFLKPMLNQKIDRNTELKLLEMEDSAELFALTDKNREYLRQWLPWLDSTNTIEDSKDFIRFSLEKYTGNKAFEAGIWFKGKLAGVIGLHEINWVNDSTAIGYWLGEEFRGNGIMTRTCQAVINYCFAELNLKNIYINCAVENARSRAIPERLGFQLEGIKENAEMLYGKIFDHAVYSLKK